MFTQDLNNNVRRLCTLRGDKSGRVWRIKAAMTGRRYLVKNEITGEFRAVSLWHDASNVY